MSALHDALAQYVTVRRALGTRLAEPAGTLAQCPVAAPCGSPAVPHLRRYYEAVRLLGSRHSVGKCIALFLGYGLIP